MLLADGHGHGQEVEITVRRVEECRVGHVYSAGEEGTCTISGLC